jgi:hypothetical protein
VLDLMRFPHLITTPLMGAPRLSAGNQAERKFRTIGAGGCEEAEISHCATIGVIVHCLRPVFSNYLFAPTTKDQLDSSKLMMFASLLGEQAYSLSQMKRWIRRFKEGDLSCERDNHIFHWSHIFGPRCTSPPREI